METFKSPSSPSSGAGLADIPNTDLIRHGKHAQQHKSDHHADQTTTHHTRDRSTDHHKARQQQQQDAIQHREREIASHAASAATSIPTQKAKTTSQHYTREAEKIVQEEKSEQSKMPIYRGLENFRLLEKMGESVIRHPFLDPLPLTP
jgi:hypothetical protein